MTSVGVVLALAVLAQASQAAPSEAPGAAEPAEPGEPAEPPRPPQADDIHDDDLPVSATGGGEAFGPTYVLEDIVVSGAEKTRPSMILAELGMRRGDVLSAGDRRFEVARLRLLTTGFFLDVQLRIARGSARGKVILHVEVVERGTLVIGAIHLGTSAATRAWGGFELVETNALGRGLVVGAGFVASSRPDVAGAESGRALRLRLGAVALPSHGLSVSATGLVSRGSELLPTWPDGSGAADPGDGPTYTALGVRRLGGTLGLVQQLTPSVRLGIDGRGEAIDSAWGEAPGPAITPATDFRLGPSQLVSGTLFVDVDTRDHPVLAASGSHAQVSLELAPSGLSRDYQFVKSLVLASWHRRLPWRHAIGLHGLAGALFGRAPDFDRFAAADLNPLLPPRVLGLGFSTQASPDLFGTGIDRRRLASLAGRVLVDYAVPLWRRRGWIYGGDLFAAAGVLTLTERDALTSEGSWSERLPLGATADLGLRLDTAIGVFNLSVGNVVGRVAF